jgi:outer membrane protein
MKNIVFVFLFLTGTTAKTQTGWDLQQCINYALSHNISLRQTSLNNEVNKNNADQSKASLLPSINAGANHVYNIGRTIDRYTNTFANSTVLSQNFFIGASVVLWSGMSQYNNVMANEYAYLSGVELLKQRQNDLSLSVANAYIGVIFSEEILKISQNQYNVSKEQLERTQKMVVAGAFAKSVEYDIKAQLANDDVNVTTADNNYRIAMLTLVQLMNLDSVTNFNIQRPELNMQESQLIDATITGMYETSIRNQPGIKSGEYSILSAERALAASRGRRSPTLTFNANMGTGTSGLAKDVVGYNSVSDTLGIIPNVGPLTYVRQDPIFRKMPFTEQFKNNINKSVGVTLQIPLFNGLQTHTAVKNAKISALNAKLGQDLTKQNLYKNITQAYANAKAALNKYNATLASVDAANESFKYAQQKFNAGTISSFDFSTSKNRLYAAESNLLQAKYDYIFKLKVLDYYQGKPLGF